MYASNDNFNKLNNSMKFVSENDISVLYQKKESECDCMKSTPWLSGPAQIQHSKRMHSV